MKMGKVYFLRRADGLIKVGFTTNLKVRLAALTRSHGPLQIIRVINGDLQREHQVHAQLAKSHESRKGIGFELKPSYFKQAVRNIAELDKAKTDNLFRVVA